MSNQTREGRMICNLHVPGQSGFQSSCNSVPHVDEGIQPHGHDYPPEVVRHTRGHHPPVPIHHCQSEVNIQWSLTVMEDNNNNFKGLKG